MRSPKRVSLNEVLVGMSPACTQPLDAREADCLVVDCPERPKTCGMVNDAAMHALGTRGFLVNIERGSIVDEPALIEALNNKKIAGAGLDVSCGEPRVPRTLVSLANAVVTAHIGTSTQEIR